MMRQVDEGLLPLAAATAEARAFLRLEGGNDEGVLAASLRSASALCEQFTGVALVSRAVKEILPASGEWQRLSRTPVLAITGVEGVPAEGSIFPLPVASYLIDIDGGGDGWVRVIEPGAAGRVRVSYSAGMAAEPGRVPEPLRHGIIQLAGHLLRERDREVGLSPPASVAALWRPWRRMRIGDYPVGGKR
jgi:uncharacterized phiE125 gp8 family phage protein